MGKVGYVSKDFVREESIDKRDLEVKRMASLKRLSPFYQNLNNNMYCYLPAYQNVFILEEVGNYYRVSVDGVIGYVEKNDTNRLTETTIVVDTSRQILKVYKKGKEVFRCHVITGAYGRETQLGCFTIGHHQRDYTFTNSDIFNEYWIQFDGNRGIHPADANGGKGLQKHSYFLDVASNAYSRWSKGNGKTYPNEHGSHGCVNTKIVDTEVIYSLCSVGDNVLIIQQNDLIRNKLLSFNTIDEEATHKMI